MNGWMDGWMDFTATGHYEIEARLAKPIYSEADDPVGGEEVSRVELDVTPRSELVLAKRCEALAGQVEAFASYESAAQAALALSHVTDPVALPYLRRVLLAKKLVEPIAIEGLEKIASADAVQALSLGLKIEYNDTAVLSRAALLRIESQTPDPTIKKEITRILSDADKTTT
jgi:hypothetical protein